jgi:hypothetical protein
MVLKEKNVVAKYLGMTKITVTEKNEHPRNNLTGKQWRGNIVFFP